MESKKITVYIDEELWREARKRAVDENISNSALVEKTLKNYLKEDVKNDYF